MGSFATDFTEEHRFFERVQISETNCALPRNPWQKNRKSKGRTSSCEQDEVLVFPTSTEFTIPSA